MLRKYRSEDLPQMLAVWESASEVAHPFLSREFLDNERLQIEHAYLPNAQTWVWEHDRQVIGFLALVGNEVGGLFVDPTFHRSGIGAAMIDFARQRVGDLEVEVFRDNAIGRAFYDKCGFQLLHESIHEATGQPILRLQLLAG